MNVPIQEAAHRSSHFVSQQLVATHAVAQQHLSCARPVFFCRCQGDTNIINQALKTGCFTAFSRAESVSMLVVCERCTTMGRNRFSEPMKTTTVLAQPVHNDKNMIGLLILPSPCEQQPTVIGRQFTNAAVAFSRSSGRVRHFRLNLRL